MRKNLNQQTDFKIEVNSPWLSLSLTTYKIWEPKFKKKRKAVFTNESKAPVPPLIYLHSLTHYIECPETPVPSWRSLGLLGGMFTSLLPFIQKRTHPVPYSKTTINSKYKLLRNLETKIRACSINLCSQNAVQEKSLPSGPICKNVVSICQTETLFTFINLGGKKSRSFLNVQNKANRNVSEID